MKLNSDLTFQTLLPTSGNRAALDACIEFAIQDARFNFLLLHGPPAVGKTHLLHAIHHATRKLKPKLRVLLITCETWTDELLGAIRSERTDEFCEKYHRMDMLLMDDVQILTGRPITQQTVADCIASLTRNGNNAALAHSGPLSAIPFLVPTNRIKPDEKTLVLEIGPPTTEEMIAIIWRKFANRYPKMPSNFVRDACSNAHGDIRRAEGRSQKDFH